MRYYIKGTEIITAKKPIMCFFFGFSTKSIALYLRNMS